MKHTPENLICLCPTCHARADTEAWGEKTLLEYKKNPWVLRKGASSSDDHKPLVGISFTIDRDFGDFAAADLQLLILAVAAFLNVASDRITAAACRPGSVVVCMTAPADLAHRLLAAWESYDPELGSYLVPFPVSNIVCSDPEDRQTRSAVPKYAGDFVCDLSRVGETESIVQTRIRILPDFDAIIGESAVMDELRRAILRAAKSDRTVLLVGEQGTGKEVAARLIHRHSDQADFKFICRHVAAEMASGFELWKALHPSAKKLEEIVAKEFRDVPFVRAADLSNDSAGWKPKDPQVARVIEEEESRLLTQHRHLYRSVLRRLHQAWQQDVFFNFFEYDSGAAATQQIAAELFGFADKRFTETEGGPGRFQTASHCGGTLFLDNIHHLDLSAQKALLKATEVRHENRRAMRAGAGGSEPLHVRIIAATTTDLRELAAEKKFLYELASRLMCEVIPIPSLNSRREDIPLLATHFAQSRSKELEPGAIEPLRKVDWHGLNVRGLQNVVESAAQTDQTAITAKAISRAIALLCSHEVKEPLNNEQIMIRDAMERAGGNIHQAAKAIGWSRQKLYRLLDHYGIDRRDFLRRRKS